MDEALSTIEADNILKDNLFIILSSIKMIAMSYLMLILHFYINVPMQWFDGKTHTFSANDWYIKSMVRTIDCLYNAMLKLEKYGQNILDEKFMLNIFKPLKLKPLDEYVKYIFD